jgi:hypothetical protein
MSDKMKKKDDDRFESIGWGLFLILLGITWIIPKHLLADGVLYIGIGIIILGYSYFKHIRGFKVSGFSLFLGFGALIIGLADYTHIDVPLLPLILIFWGISIIFGFYSKKKKDDRIK